MPERDADPVLRILQRSAPFAAGPLLKNLVVGSRRARLKAGEDLDKARPGSDVVLILSGGLGAGYRDLSGRLHLPRFFLEGSMLREDRWLLPERGKGEGRSVFPESHLWVALVPTEVALLKGEAYQAALNDAGFARSVAWRLQIEEIVGSNFLKLHASQDKKVLLARCLIMLAEHFGWLQMGKVRLDINQHLLSNFSCLSLRYVNGCLSRWSSKGLVELHKGGVTLLDDAALIRESKLNFPTPVIARHLRADADSGQNPHGA